MRAVFAFISMCCINIFCTAQNIVLNPSLENYITCPGFGQFSNTFINDWDKPSYGSTDYYHFNCPGIIPTQQAPRTGDAYAGIIGYNYGTEYREYMTGTLSAPLIPGATYYCEFYVSLNDGYIQAIKEMGAYFTANPPGPYTNALHVPVTPQIENTTALLDDTSSWMRISGYFLASGGEEYVTIGNFNTDTNTTIVQVGNVGSYGSYYFVDDVWVSLSEGTGVEEMENQEVRLYPNPVGKKLAVCSRQPARTTVQSGGFAITSIGIYNSIGNLVIENKDVNQNAVTIETGELPRGIYIAEIRCGDKVCRKKIIKE
ncbi:MAG: T9SS type A sorting domain-containing protein [Bacteroidetes bacterium]|nr:T9SS type A sorting domain-containing protein [Bacteroidota bacterium]